MTQSRVTCWSSTSLNTQFLINKSRGWLGVTWDRQILNLDIVLPHDWRCRHNQIPRRHTTSTSDHVTLSLANIWAEKLSSLGKNVCTESNEEASDDDKPRYQVHVCTVVTAASAVLPDLSLTSPISALTDWLLTYWPLQLLARCQHVRRPGREREWESTCVVWCGVVWCGVVPIIWMMISPTIHWDTDWALPRNPQSPTQTLIYVISALTWAPTC